MCIRDRDSRMPFMDGLEFIEKVIERLPAVKMIVFSGFDDFEYAQKAVSYTHLDVYKRQDKGFAKPQMFLNLFISNAGLLVIAMGQTIVMITGGIDISVGSVTALVFMVVASQMENHGTSAYAAVAIALLIGLAYGVVQGFLISYLDIQPFIVTLAGLFFGRGLTSMISTEMISIKNETCLLYTSRCV